MKGIALTQLFFLFLSTNFVLYAQTKFDIPDLTQNEILSKSNHAYNQPELTEICDNNMEIKTLKVIHKKTQHFELSKL